MTRKEARTNKGARGYYKDERKGIQEVIIRGEGEILGTIRVEAKNGSLCDVPMFGLFFTKQELVNSVLEPMTRVLGRY